MKTKPLIALYGLYVETRNLSEKSEMSSFEEEKGLSRLQAKIDKMHGLHENDLSLYDRDVLSYLSAKCEEALLKMSNESADSIHLSYIEQYGRKGNGGIHYIENELREMSCVVNNHYSDAIKAWRMSEEFSPKLGRMFPVTEKVEGIELRFERDYKQPSI